MIIDDISIDNIKILKFNLKSGFKNAIKCQLFIRTTIQNFRIA